MQEESPGKQQRQHQASDADALQLGVIKRRFQYLPVEGIKSAKLGDVFAGQSAAGVAL